MDWTFAGHGAAILEMARLVPWLLKAGHSPGEGGALGLTVSRLDVR
ncbi:hypothetical protein [Actinomadura bangladeshensis]|nr:hypothetical protein [Actinomadura bangladeshensis]